MIKLLHTEVDVVPDRKPQRQPLPEGFIGMGTGVLRISNTTERENAYTVRIRCDHPYWQDAWFRLSGIPPAPGEAPASSKPDQLGPKDQWIKVFVSNGATRDVLISFFVPRKPECRSSAYPFEVVVETQVLDSSPTAKHKERITEIRGTMILRPFYAWTTEYQPEERRAGIFRRKGAFELIVRNQSNDWLYCDVKVGKSQELLAEVETLRVAVPPPEPGKDSFRSVPLRAVCKSRFIRGAPKPTDLPLTVQRAEAPTVPPMPDEATSGVASAGLGNPGVHGDTAEQSPPEVPGRLVYNPPIPATLTGLVQSLAKNAMALSMLFIGLVVAFNLFILLFYRIARNITEFAPLVGKVKNGERILVKGNYLTGSQVWIFEKGKEGGEPLAKLRVTQDRSTGTKGDRGLVPTKSDELGQALFNKVVVLKLQRTTYLDLLTPLLPAHMAANFPVTIGDPPRESKPPEVFFPNSVQPGKPVVLTGSNLGDKGSVLFGNTPVQPSSWTNTKIVVKAPSDIMSSTVTVVLLKPDSTKLAEKALEVVFMPEETTGGETGGDVGGGPGGGTASGGGTGAGGGTATGAGSGSGSGTGGRTAGGTGSTTSGYVPIVSIPGYRELVAFDYRAASRALNAERDLQNPSAFAVCAIAYAELGQSREAREALDSAETVLPSVRRRGGGAYNDARVLIMIAKARLAEARNGQSDDVARMFGEAGDFAMSQKTLGYPGLAMVQYFVRARNFEQAKAIAAAVEANFALSAEEQATLQRIRGRIR